MEKMCSSSEDSSQGDEDLVHPLKQEQRRMSLIYGYIQEMIDITNIPTDIITLCSLYLQNAICIVSRTENRLSQKRQNVIVKSYLPLISKPE